MPDWSYDAAGNQTRVQTGSDGWQRYQYDAANRLVKVKLDDNQTVISSYTYGDTNQRLMTEEAGVRTYYAADGGATLAEYTESGGSTMPLWSKSYIYLGARLLSTLEPNGSGGTRASYHHSDRLGTRVVTGTDGSGNPTSFEQVTLPFGTALNNESTGATTRRFTSYDRSATTGLDYALNRHYDPLQGRFTQVDPIGHGASDLSDPQSLNMYSYSGNDPVNQLDPDGLFFKKLFRWIKKHWKIILIVAAVAFTVIGLTVGFGPLFKAIGQTFSKFFSLGSGGGLKGKLLAFAQDPLKSLIPEDVIWIFTSAPKVSAGVGAGSVALAVGAIGAAVTAIAASVAQGPIERNPRVGRERKQPDPCRDRPWKRTLRDLRSIAKRIGWGIKNDGTPFDVAGLKYGQVVGRLARHGFNAFPWYRPNLNFRAHGWGYHFEGQLRPDQWYHVVLHKGRENGPVATIAIHCEKGFLQPSSVLHAITSF